MIVLSSLISVGQGCMGQRVFVRAPFDKLQFLETPQTKHEYYLAQACFCQLDRLGTQCQNIIMPICKHETDSPCVQQKQTCNLPASEFLSLDLKTECRPSNSQLYFQGVKFVQNVRTKPKRLKQVLQIIWDYNQSNKDAYLTQPDIETGQRTSEFEYFQIGAQNYSFDLNKTFYLNVSLIDFSRPRFNKVLLHQTLNNTQLQDELKLQVPLLGILSPLAVFEFSVWFDKTLISLRSLRLVYANPVAQFQPHPVTHFSSVSSLIYAAAALAVLIALAYSMKVCREKRMVQRFRQWMGSRSRTRNSYEQFNEQDRSRTE